MEYARLIHDEHKAQLEAFWSAHREAFKAMRAGDPAVFPWGTYQWRVLGGQACADPPKDDRAVYC